MAIVRTTAVTGPQKVRTSFELGFFVSGSSGSPLGGTDKNQIQIRNASDKAERSADQAHRRFDPVTVDDDGTDNGRRRFHQLCIGNDSRSENQIQNPRNQKNHHLEKDVDAKLTQHAFFQCLAHPQMGIFSFSVIMHRNGMV